MSPSLGKGIGMGYVKTNQSAQEKVMKSLMPTN
jgi:glycine cleavage system aminomethyltransferase T